MACLRPKTGPPASRTLVKPRSSMSFAAFAAATFTKPMSPVSTASWGIVANMRCTWASMRPGISVRPPPSMIVADALEGTAPAPIAAIWLLRTSTEVGPESVGDRPSNTRTSRNRTSGGEASEAA